MLYGVHLWADLDRDRRMGGSRPNQNDYVFVILVTHPKSYIETTDRRDFGDKPLKWRRGRVLSWKWKIPEFYIVGGARVKNNIFCVFGYPSTILRTAYRKQFYRKPMVPMESRDSEGMPFASVESTYVTRHLADIGPWRVLKCGHVTITKIDNLHTDTRRKFSDSKNSKNAILFDLRRKKTKLSRKNCFRTVVSPGACERLAVLNWRSSSIHPSRYYYHY